MTLAQQRDDLGADELETGLGGGATASPRRAKDGMGAAGTTRHSTRGIVPCLGCELGTAAQRHDMAWHGSAAMPDSAGPCPAVPCHVVPGPGLCRAAHLDMYNDILLYKI
jgi:hypothetical protein